MLLNVIFNFYFILLIQLCNYATECCILNFYFLLFMQLCYYATECHYQLLFYFTHTAKQLCYWTFSSISIFLPMQPCYYARFPIVFLSLVWLDATQAISKRNFISHYCERSCYFLLAKFWLRLFGKFASVDAAFDTIIPCW